MYTPKAFAITAEAELQAAMRDWSFATLVTQQDNVPVASHLPLQLQAERGPYGTLIGHMARANRQWQSFSAAEVLVIFQGPHAYISPSWYTVAPSVPTWNYSAVHAYGVPQIITDEATIVTLLEAQVAQYEQSRPRPWTMDGAHAYVHKLLNGIVFFEIGLTRVEGKAKLSQNRSLADQHQVRTMLQSSTDQVEQAVGAQMADLMVDQTIV